MFYSDHAILTTAVLSISSLREPCFLFNIPSPGQQSFNPRNNSSEPLCAEKAESFPFS